MTTLANQTQKETKSAKKQKSPAFVNIGSPRTPIRSQQKKVEQERLCDWSHAS